LFSPSLARNGPLDLHCTGSTDANSSAVNQGGLAVVNRDMMGQEDLSEVYSLWAFDALALGRDLEHGA